jgi:hypothetical protein
MSKTTAEAQEELFATDTSDDMDGTTVAEGYILDFITGERHLKDTSKEQVRQRIARALFHEYGISVEDMEPDFAVRIHGRRKRLDIAIFHHSQEHAPEHLSRVVVCRPEPKVGKTAVRMRDYNQAEKDLDELKTIMQEVDACHYGLWTNGLEFFYLEKKVTRFQIGFEPIGDWPMAEESVGTRDVVSHAKTRRADPEMLRIAFRRCHKPTVSPLLSPVASRNALLLQSLPNSIPYRQAKVRRRKDDHRVGTAARGIMERLYRLPRRLPSDGGPARRVRRALSTGA